MREKGRKVSCERFRKWKKLEALQRKAHEKDGACGGDAHAPTHEKHSAHVQCASGKHICTRKVHVQTDEAQKKRSSFKNTCGMQNVAVNEIMKGRSQSIFDTSLKCL